MSTKAEKLIPFLAAGAAAVGVLFFAASTASAAAVSGPSAAELSSKAQNLLATSTYQFVPSKLTLITLDAITLQPMTPGALPAIGWAQTEKALGRRILVPLQLVDGVARSYGGNGLPTNILALTPADAASLLSSGLYVEWLG